MTNKLSAKLGLAGTGIFLVSSVLFSQQESPPAGTATISGHVTVGKDAAAGVVGAAQRRLQGEPIVLEPASAQAITDNEGSYILSGLKPGSYTVQPFAAGFVNAADVPIYTMEKTRPEKTVHLEEGDRITAIDFSLSPGGIISGRILDTDGWPVTAKQVRLIPDKGKGQVHLQFSSSCCASYIAWGNPWEYAS